MEKQARATRDDCKAILDLAEAVPREVTPAFTLDVHDLNQYPDARGARRIREVIAERENAKYGLQVSPDQVVITNGATEAIFLLVHAFTAPGDTVLVQEPSILLYRDIIENQGARIRRISEIGDCGAPDSCPRLWFVHNPSNPCGAILDSDTLNDQLEIARSLRCVLVRDQVYDEFQYGLPRAQEEQHTIDSGALVKINSVSKTFGAPGLRLGWITCSRDLASTLSGLAERLRIGVSHLVQQYGIRLLSQPLDRISATMAARREIVRAWSASVSHFVAPPPSAGVWYWLRLRDELPDASVICERALRDFGVWMLPGQSFWCAEDRYIRLSFGAPPAILTEALRKVEPAFRPADGA